jgi:hypothetical protein
MIKDIRLFIRTDDGREIDVELEPQSVKAVVKLLGLEIEGEAVTMTRRKRNRESKALISDGSQQPLFGSVEAAL